MQYAVTGIEGRYFLNRVLRPLLQVSPNAEFGPFASLTEAENAKKNLSKSGEYGTY